MVNVARVFGALADQLGQEGLVAPVLADAFGPDDEDMLLLAGIPELLIHGVSLRFAGAARKPGKPWA